MLFGQSGQNDGSRMNWNGQRDRDWAVVLLLLGRSVSRRSLRSIRLVGRFVVMVVMSVVAIFLLEVGL